MKSKFENGSFYIFILVFFLTSNVVIGQTEKTLIKSWPLSHFMTSNEQIVIRNASGTYELNFPVSDRIKPISAVLDLTLTNSNVLKNNRSQVVIYVNDYLIGQIKLDPINNTTKVIYQIAPEYIIQGYNKITFKAAQHYTDSECEDWSAPELWTQFDAVKSSLTLNYQNLPITEKLSKLNSLINDRLEHYSLTIIRGDKAVSDDYLYWGSIIAQGVKLRLKYVPLKLEESYMESTVSVEGNTGIGQFKIDMDQLNNDAVIVGNKDQIKQLLPDHVAQAIEGPYLGLFQQHPNTHQFILVISGQTDDEVKSAVQSFALLNASFPDAQQTVINALNFPVAEPLLPDKSIIPGNTYTFSSLDFYNQFMDIQSSEARLEFRLPADLYSTEETLVKLNLNLAYGAAMRKDSVINISLNNGFVHAIQLKEESGAHYRNYQISVPLRNFKPGLNTLTFKSVLTPSEYGECAFVQRENLLANVYEDSTLSFPETGRVANLPDLKLLERTGFPLLNNASGDNTVFKMLDTSSDSIASAWYLIAQLVSYQGTPVFDLNITQSDNYDKKNIALIGKISAKNIPPILDGAPVKLGKTNLFPYRFKERQLAQNESLIERFERVLFDNNMINKPVATERENVVISQTAGLGNSFLMMSYLSQKRDGVVLALLSEGSTELYSGLTELFSTGLWSQVQGNIFVWDKNGKFHWERQGESIMSGDDSLKMTWIMHFSKYPWQWLGLIFSILLFTAWLIHKFLSRYKKATHS
ncbi:cellulose biosynthesis cyclic di-GMP-binding regulatory protein BcsB [Methylicorpusculum sp.]|uniref:cellulose biosynthesis cyclic di-GMP-binding regulatory protein BcsB n=1 Tax=Methylicorpusculum sp. TaxID=2713644 RepID=UPI002720DF15|nr:cellulose biosynthesis cyclic di-GMP-binding regulatory protein BcsB [Methylicorpusculum sp.]MDO8845186.1 cellulose biosynthesis cyclic di-GMP-binding regulatory protein BcsB [Methylicorpusculum sp.]